MLLNVVLEKILESSLDCKKIQPVHPKGDQSWVFTGRTDVKLKLQYFGHLMWGANSLKRPWCWERFRAGGEGDNRGWDGWMASLTQWTWVWVYSGRWWWRGKHGMLRFMGSQRVRHDWGTELNWIRLVIPFLPRSKSLNFMAAVTVYSDFGAQENKVCHFFHCFHMYLPWSDRTGCHDLSFLTAEF